MIAKDEINTGNYSTGRKILNVFLFILLLLVVLFVAFMVYIKSQNIDLENITVEELKEKLQSQFTFNEEEPAPVELDYNQVVDKAIGASSDYVIKCTDLRVTGIDRKGNVAWDAPFDAEKLILDTAGEYVACADQEGRNVMVIKRDKIVRSWQTDNPIISISLDKEGYLAVVTEPSDYKSRLTLYDPLGVEIFTYNIVNRYVISADIHKDKNIIVINTLDTEGVKPLSNIEFVDLSGNYLSAVTVQEEGILPFAHLFDSGNVAAVGKGAIIFYNGRKETIKSISHNSIYSSAVVDGKYLVAAVRYGSGNNMLKTGKSEILIYNDRGELTGSSVITGDVVNMRAMEDIVGVNNGRGVLFMDKDGKVIDSYPAGSDISDFHFLNMAEAVIVSNEKIVLYKIKHKGREINVLG